MNRMITELTHTDAPLVFTAAQAEAFALIARRNVAPMDPFTAGVLGVGEAALDHPLLPTHERRRFVDIAQQMRRGWAP